MPFQLEIITAERVLFEGEVETVVAPGSEGELGVLPHHAAVMTTRALGSRPCRTRSLRAAIRESWSVMLPPSGRR